MVMPIDLVLVRHGESEANIVQKQNKLDTENYEFPTNFSSRHDSRMRLTEKGVQQAEKAGEWLREHELAEFSDYYVSPHLRTLETAGHLRLGGNWIRDDRWRERDWGEFGTATIKERDTFYKRNLASRALSEWYWCPTGGESLAAGVRLRFEDILDTLHRQSGHGKVIAVVHGEMIRTAQFVIERMTPLQWEEMDDDEAYKMSNCQILHYTRKNPETGELTEKLQWRRSISPWDSALSWNDGQWTKIEPRTYSDEDLITEADSLPRIF
jgi:broad specificity phosphatase PhoE